MIARAFGSDRSIPRLSPPRDTSARGSCGRTRRAPSGRCSGHRSAREGALPGGERRPPRARSGGLVHGPRTVAPGRCATMRSMEERNPRVPPDPTGIEEPHDVLAAEEFGIGYRDERLPPDQRHPRAARRAGGRGVRDARRPRRRPARGRHRPRLSAAAPDARRSRWRCSAPAPLGERAARALARRRRTTVTGRAPPPAMRRSP